MRGVDQWTEAYYRQVVDDITGFAREARDSEVRQELLELAERFRRLAAYVETRCGSRGT